MDFTELCLQKLHILWWLISTNQHIDVISLRQDVRLKVLRTLAKIDLFDNYGIF